MWVPLSSISIGTAERDAVIRAIENGMISSTAPVVAEFEAEMARLTERAHAVATNSGTSALELCLMALAIGPGDEVIVPAFSFAAPALAVLGVGATPVFADIDDSWNIAPAACAQLITKRTKALIAVDTLGVPADYDALDRLGIPVIEDAAEAFGARYKGQPAGACGVAAIFSFHANKVVSGGEGGCIACDDPDLASRLRQLNNFGIAPERRYFHTEAGCNRRLAGLAAAVILAQLKRSDALITGRGAVAEKYDAALAGEARFERRPLAPDTEESMWLYALATDDRDAVVEHIRARGVDARAVWPCLVDNPVFARRLAKGLPQPDVPKARSVAGRTFWLPTFADMSPEQIEHVINAVLSALGRPMA